eukprot:TRINITY_DN1618_c0_g1_i2.p1 TRINITY_DN1618_c0_g1~~TRINITY_DN1618_c0_g1_i2.p1  ORF type:complete len:848 (+),score=166.21 TRINITY_DN1618_c0_g1_i2:251-2794(+)
MAPITMAGESEDDTRRFEAYQQLLRLAGSYQDTAGTVPQLAVVGIESHGKSSLVQAYVGFPCTFIGQGTATRCPVEYTLSNAPDLDDPVVDFRPPNSSGETIPASQLESALGRHMKSLGDGFSHEPVRVKVQSKDCVNIVLLDLPGIIINPAEGKERNKALVDDIVQYYACQPSNFLILVEKAVPSANSEALPKEMKRLVEHVRPNWKKECIQVATMFDQQIKGGNLASISAAAEFYKTSQHPNQPKKHYVSLLPRGNGGDAIGHIRRQRQLEQELVDNWIAQISANASPGEAFPQVFKEQIGLERARAAIQDKFYELISTTGAFSKLRQTLRDNKLHYEAEVKRRKQLLDGVMKPGNLRTSVDKLSREYLSGINSLFQYTNAMRKPFDSKCMDFYTEVTERSREKLGDDDAAPVPFEPEWRTQLNQLCKDDEMIRYEVVAPLLGSTQINRATMVFKYLTLGCSHEDWSNPGLQKRVFGHLAGSTSTKTNYDKGIGELVKGGLTDNLTESACLKWYLDHLEWILRHNGRLVMEHVLKTGGFGDLKDSQVPSKVLADYWAGVHSLIKEIEALFLKSSWTHSQYVAHMQVAELIEILDAIPRVMRGEAPRPPASLEPTALPPTPPPADPAAQPNGSSSGPSGQSAEDDEFVDSAPPPGQTAGKAVSTSSSQGMPRPSPPPSAPASGANTDFPSKSGYVYGNTAGNQALVYNGNGGVEAGRGRGDETFFPSLRDVPPPTTGLPSHIISAVCNRKPEGTPAVASPSLVCAWVRETYFFNLILLLRELEYLVNSMVVLEMNGEVTRNKIIDDAINSVMRLDVRAFLWCPPTAWLDRMHLADSSDLSGGVFDV